MIRRPGYSPAGQQPETTLQAKFVDESRRRNDFRASGGVAQLFESVSTGAAADPWGVTSPAADRPPLDNRGAALTPASQEEAVQAEPHAPKREGLAVRRWRLKHTVASVLRDVPDGEKTPGVCKCGTARPDEPMVALTLSNGRPGVAGVYFCDSPWLCPTCAPRRAAQRAERVLQVFDATDARNGRVVFLTLTVRHDRKGNLASLKRLVQEACRKARQGKPWALAKERFGIAGTLVSPEVTWSPRHGWHFHLHLSLVVLRDDDDLAEEAGEWLVERYMSYIRRAGGRCQRKGQDVQVVWRREDAAAYVAKGSAAWEVASAGATKEGRKGKTPWDLAALAGKGDAEAAALFREYAAAMPGTRSCVITPALAAALGLAPADDEDDPGVEERPEDVEIVGELEAPRWHRILRRGHAADVLRLVGEGRPWMDVEGLVRKLLREPEPESLRAYSGPPVHAPTAEDTARLAAAEAFVSGRRKGAALAHVLTREREQTQARGLVYLAPNLRDVLDRMAA